MGLFGIEGPVWYVLGDQRSYKPLGHWRLWAHLWLFHKLCIWGSTWRVCSRNRSGPRLCPRGSQSASQPPSAAEDNYPVPLPPVHQHSLLCCGLSTETRLHPLPAHMHRRGWFDPLEIAPRQLPATCVVGMQHEGSSCLCAWA